jgi:phosphatidylserine/phosphatidylglycerophosphate/cardiolipin synthase-like enzyme
MRATRGVGVDLTDNIFLQYDVHNKGFVIDHKTVVVSSQNFSPAGVHDNRDAGLIIENSEIAVYYENVFLSDWKTKTQPASAASATKTTNTGKGKKGKASPSAAPKKKQAPKKTSSKETKQSPSQPKKSRRKP